MSVNVTFSDGIDTEEYLLSAISEAKDLSLQSRELRTAIRDWPSEYHLTPARANIFKAFDLSKVQSVLEIGAGCGAVTRFLGEKGFKVVSVEGSRARANICAARCRDLQNISVESVSLEDFSSPLKFSMATLIGVMEYFPAFSDKKDPITENLKKIYNSLESDGTLVIAIENKLGLKYLAGYPEDHLSRPFIGVEGNYSSKDPQTFGRRELEIILSNAGYNNIQFVYPYTDYKIPTVLLTEKGVTHDSFRAGDLLSRVKNRAYGDVDLLPTFDEELALEGIAANNLLGELANSFIVIAQKGRGVVSIPNELLAVIAPHADRGGIESETRFRESDGKIIVSKTHKLPSEQSSSFALRDTEVDYEEGTLFFNELKRKLSSGGGLSELTTWSREYLEFLKLNEISGTLPTDFVDCVPYNLIRKNDQKLIYIDNEWVSAEPIPLAWVFIRGLAYSLAGLRRKGSLVGKRYGDVIKEVGKAIDYPINDAEVASATQWERKLNAHIFGSDSPEASKENLYLTKLLKELISDTVTFIADRNVRLQNEVTRLQAAFAEAEERAEMTESSFKTVVSSKSWKITAPLRGLKGLLRV